MSENDIKNKNIVTESSVNKINIDIDDIYNTQPKDDPRINYFKNYSIFGSLMFKKVLKSKLFLIFVVIIPLLFTFIEVFAFSSLSPTVIAIDLINYFIVLPMVLMGLLILPSFISQSRENNLLKRLILIGITKKQLFYCYMFFSISSLAIIFCWWFGPWMFILINTVNAIMGEKVYNGINVFFVNLDLFKFIILLIFSLIGIISMGYMKSMKVNSSRGLMGWGIGLWIFISFSVSSIFIFPINIIKSDLVESSLFGEIIIKTLFFILKWMFIFTIPSIMVVGFLTTANLIQDNRDWPETIVKIENLDSWILGIQILTIILSVYLFTKIFLFKTKLTSLESSR